MRVLRRLLALVVWVAATVLTLFTVILCVTLVLLPRASGWLHRRSPRRVQIRSSSAPSNSGAMA
jgi:hypothetical protein